MRLLKVGLAFAFLVSGPFVRQNPPSQLPGAGAFSYNGAPLTVTAGGETDRLAIR